jgi:2-amino-4-hydroxy-6-hydroxymethyldihydropteridine diphosphokinase
LSEPEKPKAPGIPCPENSFKNPEGLTIHRVYLGIGSNIDPEQNLTRALQLLCQKVLVEAVSSVWETPPIGLKGENFLNAAAVVETQFTYSVLKESVLHPIESQLGRIRTGNKYDPRPIDLDILIFDDKELDQKIWQEAFLAVPLAELLPEYSNPKTQETLSQTAKRLISATPVIQRPDIWSGLLKT